MPRPTIGPHRRGPRNEESTGCDRPAGPSRARPPGAATKGRPLNETRPPAALRIDRALYDRLLAHAAAAAPQEAVGLLAVGGEDGARAARVTRFYPGTNLDASPTRYTMDPAEVLAALRDIEARGWRLGAIVHSHPSTPAVPSATDLREARYPDALMVIVGLADAPPAVRAWRVIPATGQAAAGVAEVPLLVDPIVQDRGTGFGGPDAGRGGSMADSGAARSPRPGT